MILLLAASVQAQSLADAARKERERQSTLKPVFVLTSQGKSSETKTAETKVADVEPADSKAASDEATSAAPPPPKEAPKEAPKEPPKPQAPPQVDPVQVWNTQLDQLRVKIRGLQDQELALQLEQTRITNQVYAPVTDPATQERAQQQLGQTLRQLETVREQLGAARRELDALQLQGPKK